MAEYYRGKSNIASRGNTERKQEKHAGKPQKHQGKHAEAQWKTVGNG